MRATLRTLSLVAALLVPLVAQTFTAGADTLDTPALPGAELSVSAAWSCPNDALCLWTDAAAATLPFVIRVGTPDLWALKPAFKQQVMAWHNNTSDTWRFYSASDYQGDVIAVPGYHNNTTSPFWRDHLRSLKRG